MDNLTLFGVASVSLMLVAYALENRTPAFVVMFAGACAASSLYGFLVGAWPFGIVEAVWTVVAIGRWRSRVTVEQRASTRPIACDMTALAPAERHRYDDLRRLVLDAVRDVRSMDMGFRLRIDENTSATNIAEWMALEHRCCPFLTLQLALKEDGTWIELGGSVAIKEFLREEFKRLATR